MQRKIAIAAGAAIVIVALVIASQAFRPSAPELPVATAEGLPVINVSAAIDARDGLDETQPVAVFGWFSHGPPHSCNPPSGPDGRSRIPSEIELYCYRGEIVLAERPQSGVEVQDTGDSMSARLRQLDGPWLDPYLGSMSVQGGIHPAGIAPWKPHPIIAVGHFRDHRAADCAPEDIPFCLNVFVVDHIANVGGVARGPVERIDRSGGPPKAAPGEVADAVRARLGPNAEVIVTASMRWKEVSNYEDRADPPIDGRSVWLVRAIDPGPKGSVTPRLRALVLDDVTLEILWQSELPTD